MSTAADLFARAEVVLLDFDGPICSVFAHHPPELASRAAVQVLAARGIEVPGEWASRSDPHQLLEDLASLRGTQAEDVRFADEAICRQEIEAVAKAPPTSGILELLDSLGSRRWGVVSNNCQSAVNGFFGRARLPAQPDVVAGRGLGDPTSLKPAPELLNRALRQLGAQASAAVFIGDSTSDVWAGLSAGIPVIGYENKPEKTGRLARAGASAVVGQLGEMLPISDERR